MNYVTGEGDHRRSKLVVSNCRRLFQSESDSTVIKVYVECGACRMMRTEGYDTCEMQHDNVFSSHTGFIKARATCDRIASRHDIRGRVGSGKAMWMTSQAGH